MKKKKLLLKIISSQQNVRFHDLQKIVESFSFVLDRVKGSHHIYVHPHIPELLNIQNVKGEAKPYQIKQFLSLVERYNLPQKEDE